MFCPAETGSSGSPWSAHVWLSLNHKCHQSPKMTCSYTCCRPLSPTPLQDRPLVPSAPHQRAGTVLFVLPTARDMSLVTLPVWSCKKGRLRSRLWRGIDGFEAELFSKVSAESWVKMVLSRTMGEEGCWSCAWVNSSHPTPPLVKTTEYRGWRDDMGIKVLAFHVASPRLTPGMGGISPTSSDP